MDRAQQLFKQGAQFLAEKKYDEAIAKFSRAIYLSPNQANLYSFRAEALLHMSDCKSAMLDYRTAARLMPQSLGIRKRHAMTHFFQGRIYLDEGNFVKALTAFDEAVRIDRNNVAFLLHRVKAYMGQEDYERALDELNVILDVQESPEGLKVLGNIPSHLDSKINLITSLDDETSSHEEAEIQAQLMKRGSSLQHSTSRKKIEHVPLATKIQTEDGFAVQQDANLLDTSFHQDEDFENRIQSKAIVHEPWNPEGQQGPFNPKKVAHTLHQDEVISLKFKEKKEKYGGLTKQPLNELATLDAKEQTEVAQEVPVQDESDSADEAETEKKDHVEKKKPALLLTRAARIDAIILRAKVYFLLDKAELAQKDVGWVHSLSPYHPDVGKMMDALGQRSDYFFTSATAHILTGEYGKAIAELTSAIELFPYETRLYELRATCYRKHARFDDALADLKIGLSLCWQQGEASEEDQKENNADFQETLQRRTSVDKTRTSLTVVTDATPAELGAEHDIPELSLLQRIEIGLADTFNALALKYYAEEKYITSVRCLNRAIQCYPKAEFYINRGDCYRQLKELHRALNDYHEAKQMAPNVRVVTIRLSLIHCEFGRLFFNSRQHERASIEFTNAIELSPSWQYYFFRGKANLALTRLNEAYQDLLEALRINPNNPDVQRELHVLRSQVVKQPHSSQLPSQELRHVLSTLKYSRRKPIGDIKAHVTLPPIRNLQETILDPYAMEL